MYVLGMAVAIGVAYLIHLLDRKKAENNLLIELPEYKAPSARTVWIYVWEKVKDLSDKSGNDDFYRFHFHVVRAEFRPGRLRDGLISQSFGSAVGKAIVPMFTPLGLGHWQLVVALIAGISAKEVVVSSCSVLFGISNITAPSGMSMLASALGSAGFGPPERLLYDDLQSAVQYHVSPRWQR